MLTCISPKSFDDIYTGRYKPTKIAITTNSDISSWNTNADDTNTGKIYCVDKEKETYAQIVTENPPSIKSTCMLDEIGCITTDSSKAKSILYQEVKDGKIITRQELISDTDKQIAELWKLTEEINKGIQERELMWEKISRDLDYVDVCLAKNNKSSYWAYTTDGDCHTWEI